MVRLGLLTTYATLLHYENTKDTQAECIFQGVMRAIADIKDNSAILITKLQTSDHAALLQLSSALENHSTEGRRLVPWVQKFPGNAGNGRAESDAMGSLSAGLQKNLNERTYNIRGRSLNHAHVLDMLYHHRSGVRTSAGKAMLAQCSEAEWLKSAHARVSQIVHLQHRLDTSYTQNAAHTLYDHEAGLSDKHLRHWRGAVWGTEGVPHSLQQETHRFYDLKRQTFGDNPIKLWDVYAPLPFTRPTIIGFQDARKLIIKAFDAIHPDMARFAAEYLSPASGLADLGMRNGKDGTAFTLSLPAAHQFLSQGYRGKPYDVQELAHELAHAFHYVQSNHKGALLYEPQLLVQEVVATFAEWVTADALLEHAKQSENPAATASMLMPQIENACYFSLNCAAMHEFEVFIHKDPNHIPGIDEMNQQWLEILRQSCGNALVLEGNEGVLWSQNKYLSDPFYLATYSKSFALAMALKEKWREDPKGFWENFMEMLKAGSTNTLPEHMERFGINLDDPQTWQCAVREIRTMNDTLQTLNKACERGGGALRRG